MKLCIFTKFDILIDLWRWSFKMKNAKNCWYCVTSVKVHYPRPQERSRDSLLESVVLLSEPLLSTLRSTMWLIFEIFVVLFKIFICYIEAVFRTVVRPSKKNIEGQTVLITGKANASYTCTKPAPFGDEYGHQTVFARNLLTNESWDA